MHNYSKGTYRYGFFTFSEVSSVEKILKIKNFHLNGKKMSVKRIKKSEKRFNKKKNNQPCPVHGLEESSLELGNSKSKKNPKIPTPLN